MRSYPDLLAPNAFLVESLLGPEPPAGGGGSSPPNPFLPGSELDTGWPWPLDAVQRFFEDMLNTIYGVASRVWDFFQDKLREAIEWLWGHIAWPLARFVWEVYNITYEWTEGWPEPWATVARFLLFPAAFTYKTLRDYVAPALSNVLSEVRKHFDGAVGGIFDAIRNAFSPIFDPLATFAEEVKRFLTETIPSFVKAAVDFFTSLPARVAEFFDWIRETFQRGWEGLVEFFTRTLPDWLGKLVEFFEKLPEKLRELLTRDLPEALRTFLTAAYEWLSEKVGKPVAEALSGLFDRVSEAVRAFFRTVVGYYGRLVEAFEARGIEGVLEELIPVLGLGAALAVAVDMASLKVVGSGIDPQAIRQFLDRTVFKFVDIGIFTSVFLAIAVQKPLEYAARRAFRTERPSPGDALRFLAKNIATREEAAEYLRMAGYPDAVVEKYLRSIFREPPFEAIFTAYRRGRISREEYNSWLKVLNVDVAETLDGTLYPYRVLEETAYRLPSPFLLYALAETGEIPEDVLRRLFEYEPMHPEFIEPAVRGLMARGQRDERSLLRRYVIEQFQDWVMSRTEFEHYLAVLGTNLKYGRDIVEVADVSRRKAIRRKLLSYLERQFLEGYMSREELVSQLVSYGFDEEMVREYAALLQYVRDNYVVVKETKDERSALKSSLVDKYKRGYISEEELEAELRRLNLNEVEVMLTVARAKLEYDAEQKEILFKDLVERLRQGWMSKSEFVDQCTRLGIRYERCLAYADYYWSKYIGEQFYVITKDERSALASALIRKYVLGFMEEEELRQELRRLMFTEEEIELRVRRAIVEDEVKYLSDLVAEADTLLRKGQVTPEEYVRYLVSLGMRRDRAEARARKLAPGLGS